MAKKEQSLKESKQFAYKYNEQGLRIEKKSSDGTITKYVYDGNKLIAEIAPTYRLDFLYDEHNLLYGFVKDGSDKYFYVRDFMQNIIGIIDSNGLLVVQYNQTAYGKITVLKDTANLANFNPFRYKGYYYDQESGMYYCQSRYYVPEWCRWLNIDKVGIAVLRSNNTFNAYHGNNPNSIPLGICDNGCNEIYPDMQYETNSQYNTTVNNRKSRLFGYELRFSYGWEYSSSMATGLLGRIGVSSYYTNRDGKEGAIYAFAGSTSDSLNLIGTTYYFGVGINVCDVFGVEVQLETVGASATVSICDFSVSLDVNIIGGTSITIGHTTRLKNGDTLTEGLTIGVNTGLLFFVAVNIYSLLTTGSMAPIQSPSYVR